MCQSWESNPNLFDSKANALCVLPSLMQRNDRVHGLGGSRVDIDILRHFYEINSFMQLFIWMT